MLVRPMLPADIDAVRDADLRAFGPYHRQKGRAQMPPRARENLLACRALHPAGCFVAEDEGVAGYIFSRVWGMLGWIGVFGVGAERQGRGIGGQLLAAAVESLERAGCTTIGLETMPDSPNNVGLYAGRGFRPAVPTLTLAGAVQAHSGAPATMPLSRAGPAGLTAVTDVSHAALPGLDLAVEARNAAEFGWGETLLFGWPDPWAAAVMRTAAKREGDTDVWASPQCVVVAPEARPRIGAVLQALETYAAERGATEITVPVNAADWTTLQTILAAGYKVTHVAMRMLIKGDYACPPGVEMSRWTM